MSTTVMSCNSNGASKLKEISRVFLRRGCSILLVQETKRFDISMSLSALFPCPRFVLLHTIEGQGLLTIVDRFKLPDDTIITIRDCSKNTNILIHSIDLDYNKSIYIMANIYHSPKILYNQAFF